MAMAQHSCCARACVDVCVCTHQWWVREESSNSNLVMLADREASVRESANLPSNSIAIFYSWRR